MPILPFCGRTADRLAEVPEPRLASCCEFQRQCERKSGGDQDGRIQKCDEAEFVISVGGPALAGKNGAATPSLQKGSAQQLMRKPDKAAPDTRSTANRKAEADLYLW